MESKILKIGNFWAPPEVRCLLSSLKLQLRKGNFKTACVDLLSTIVSMSVSDNWSRPVNKYFLFEFHQLFELLSKSCPMLWNDSLESQWEGKQIERGKWKRLQSCHQQSNLLTMISFLCFPRKALVWRKGDSLWFMYVITKLHKRLSWMFCCLGHIYLKRQFLENVLIDYFSSDFVLSTN